MSDVVIIPTHERPEFLWITLENIAKASRLDGKLIWICEDIHIDKPKSAQLQEEIQKTIEFAKNILPIEHFQISHANHGSSFNVLESFQRACNTNADLIYFIEDDVWIADDFFRFCEAAQELWDPFATGPNCSPQSKTTDKDEMCEISSTWFQTFAMSFQRARLKEMLLSNYDDYRIMQNAGWYEWDEYTQKYMERTKQYIVNPILSRGFHFGVYSYHTGSGAFPGSLAERILQTRAIIAKPGTARDINAARDIKERIPVNPYVWNHLKKHAWRSLVSNRGPRNKTEV